MIFQIGSALLDACVLSVLEREDMYGYILTQNVRGCGYFRIHVISGTAQTAKGSISCHL